MPQLYFFSAGVGAFHRRNVCRGWKVSGDGVQEIMDALGEHGTATQDRHHFLINRGLPQRSLQVLGGDLFAFQVLEEQVFVSLNDLLDHRLTILFVLFLEFGGHVHFVRLFRYALIDPAYGIHGGFAGDQVDHPAELVLSADGQLDRNGVAVKTAADGFDGALVARADPVHLVDETDTGDLVGVCLPPDRLRLRLDSCNRVQHDDTAV